MSKLLIDTDVIIDYLRGHKKAKNYITKQSNQLFLSSITIAELYTGVRDDNERNILEQFISCFDIIPTDTSIATMGGLYRRDYYPSHGTGLADALIAATAQSISAKLVTLNKKHFPMLQKVVTPYQK